MENKLSKRQLANSLGISHSYLVRLINGERNARLPLAKRLAEWIGGIPEDWLVPCGTTYRSELFSNFRQNQRGNDDAS